MTLSTPQPITLATPIPYGTGTLEKLTLTRPKAGALTGLKLVALAEMDVDTILAVVARSADQPVSVEQLRAVQASDLPKLIEAAATLITGDDEQPEEADGDSGYVALRHPVTAPDGTEVVELLLRAPTAGDLRGLRLAGLGDLDVDLVLTVAERCSTRHLRPGTLRLLDPADLLRLGKAVSGFFSA